MVGVALVLVLSSAGKTAPSAEARARAKALTVQSIREYNVGQFDQALADVTEAYMLSGLPALLFNLGQCERALGNWSKAELFFRNYLRDSPHAKNRAETETLIAQVRAKAKGVRERVQRAASASRGSRRAGHDLGRGVGRA